MDPISQGVVGVAAAQTSAKGLMKDTSFIQSLANLYEATFLPRRMIDLHEVSSVGFLSTNNSLFIF